MDNEFEPRDFILTDDHVKVVKRTYVSWFDGPYEGSVSVDPKRPYGNSGGVARDIAEILGWDLFVDADGEKHISKEQTTRAKQLHRDTEDVFQIMICTGRLEVGKYRKLRFYDAHSWVRADDK